MRSSTAFILGVTIAVVSLKACCMIANAQEPQPKPKSGIVDLRAEQYLYKLTGHSNLTGERVLAYLNPYPDNTSRLVGIIYEGHHTFHTQARWDGKGLVYAETIISSYTLEVIE
jgi:hypothetical protein